YVPCPGWPADRAADERAMAAVLVAERYADRSATTAEWGEACWAVGVECAEHQGQPVYEACFYTTLERAIEGMWSCAHYTVHASLDRSEDPPDPEDVDRRNVARQKRERRYQTHLLREIFGNPFRPVTLDPAWLTSTVVALAQGIYEERAFDRMPILADALQDA